MNLLIFLVENWDSMLVVLVALIAVAAIVVRKQWGLIDKLLFGLVTWAEREYGSGTGALKLTEVIQRIYPHIPMIIKIFLSEKRLEEIIDATLEKAKEAWRKNPRLIDTATK
ncbi:MAG: hypothetical protein LBK75_08780 [Oscillospiraceae bacterium]|nr:hypothetical protein [Oscillospiraceae bacterium]